MYTINLPVHPKTEARFWSKVQKTRGCWLWIGAKNRGGYGEFQGHRAHRFSYAMAYGTLPEAVLHRCDNPACVKPGHLRGGTQLDNMRDKQVKDRCHHMASEESPTVKLTAAQVAEIRASDEIQIVLAARYNVNRSQISRIRANKTWVAATA